jgi:hypothetical protein
MAMIRTAAIAGKMTKKVIASVVMLGGLSVEICQVDDVAKNLL